MMMECYTLGAGHLFAGIAASHKGGFMYRLDMADFKTDNRTLRSHRALRSHLACNELHGSALLISVLFAGSPCKSRPTRRRASRSQGINTFAYVMEASA